MALINCKECGNQVSNKAASCPKCGAKVGTGESEGYKQIKVVIAVVFALIVAYSVISRFTEKSEFQKSLDKSLEDIQGSQRSKNK